MPELTCKEHADCSEMVSSLLCLSELCLPARAQATAGNMLVFHREADKQEDLFVASKRLDLVVLHHQTHSVVAHISPLANLSRVEARLG